MKHKTYEEDFNDTLNFALEKANAITIKGVKDSNTILRILKATIETAQFGSMPLVLFYEYRKLFEDILKNENIVTFATAKEYGENKVFNVLKKIIKQIDISKADKLLVLVSGCSDKEQENCAWLLKEIAKNNCETICAKELNDTTANEIQISMLAVEIY